MSPRSTRVVRPGLPGGPDGPPDHRPKAWSTVAPIALVLAVVLGVWLLNGRDPGTGTGSPDAVDGTTYVGSYDSSGAYPDMSSAYASDGLSAVVTADLPVEAREVLDLIDAGGPFDHAEDGGTFGNYEGLLPDEPRGYYAEYTVDTPGSDTRGARRIIAGDAGERYWTADHYASFALVIP